MDRHELLQYRAALLRAGLGYRRVQRHLRELQDHYRDLRQQAELRGLTGAEAAREARAALGDLDSLGREMTSNVVSSVWHRHPFWLVTLLPSFVYVLLFVPIAGVVVAPALLAKKQLTLQTAADWLYSSSLTDFVIWQQTWVVLPLLVCALVMFCMRNQLPRRHAVAGVLLLCLLGSGSRFFLDLVPPDSGQLNTLGFSIGYNKYRLLLNLAIAGLVACYCSVRERRALQEVPHDIT